MAPKGWYSALELENIAKNHIETNKIDFDFADTETAIWVSTSGGRILAKVYFTPLDYGEPALDVRIGRNGKVVGYDIAPMVCGSFLK